MANGEIQKYADMVALQIASEAFLKGSESSNSVMAALFEGNGVNSILPESIAQQFDAGERYSLIAHQDISLNSDNALQANNKSGFSASLFYDNETNEYTFSIRSTEFDTEIRDMGDILADIDIGIAGWAFGQVQSMELFWDYLLNGDPNPDPAADGITIPGVSGLADFRNALAGGAKINVTGYSLGGNLAQAFTELHRDTVLHTYLFNAAGTGRQGPTASNFEEALQIYRDVFADPSTAFPPGSELLYGDPDDPGDAAVRFKIMQWYADPDATYDSLYDNPGHVLALQWLQDSDAVVGAIASSSLALDPNDVPHASDDQIVDIWASNYDGDSGPDVLVSRSGQRHGQSRPIWYEDQPLAYWENIFTEETFDWGTGHSIVLLQDSLALMAAFESIAPDITEDKLADIFAASSQHNFDTLESALDSLGRVVGVTDSVDAATGDGAFAEMALRNAFHDKLARIADSPAYQALIGNGVIDIFDPETIQSDAGMDIGRFLSLYYLAPFSFSVSDPLAESQLVLAHGEIGAAWAADKALSGEERAQGLATFSDPFLEDRTEFLAALVDMNGEDLLHGDSTFHGHFSDLEYDIAFNTDAISYGGGEISDLRARLVFGSQGDDINTLLASSQPDRLYGMAGDDSIDGMDGSDYLEGGRGDDHLRGGDAGDRVLGGTGNDSLEGGPGNDYLLGGAGADTYHWNSGDGDDVIGDYDDAGDRIHVNGIDLATLQFERVSAGSPYHADSSQPGLVLHYAGDFLTVTTGDGPDAGSITVTGYLPAAGADYGIVLHDYAAEPAPVTAIAVDTLGTSDLEQDNQTRANAYDRQFFAQRGLDWSALSISFEASAVSNYAGGALHGTLGGAFEGGPVDDYLAGDQHANALHGLGGNDDISGEQGDDLLEGGAGSDVLSGGDGSDLVFGSARVGLAATLDPLDPYGQFYLQQIADAPDDSNTISGGGGDDGLSGGEYADYLDGGAGNDYLLGGTGHDYISGGDDRDVIYGDSALHYRYVEVTPGITGEQLEIAFADGADSVGQYDDVIHAGSGADTVWGELGNDEIHGEDGGDNLIGDRYDDSAYFSLELPAYGDSTPGLDDALHGDDRLYGGAGDDLLLGLGGDDLLAGGVGTDSLLGGAGDDTYYLSAGDGLDYIADTDGIHTLVFSGVRQSDLQVLFQGDQVQIGTGYGAEGFYLARSEWDNVRIALNTPDAVIERSRLDTLYFDAAGNLLLSINGSSATTEAERDALFTVDDSDPDKPVIVVSAEVDEVGLEALAGGGDGAIMRVVSGNLQFLVELAVLQLSTGLEFLRIAEGLALLLSGFDEQVSGTDGADWIIGSGGPDNISGGNGGDVLEGRGGNDDLDGGYGDDLLLGEGGDDTLYGGFGNDFLDGGPGDDTLDGGGGQGNIYYFDANDGIDALTGTYPGNFEFGAGVNPDDVVLYYTDTTDSEFRIEYSPDGAIVSTGDAFVTWIFRVTVDGADIPLVQRSYLQDGTFYDTYGDDVFEPGSGSDMMHAEAWGDNAYRFFSGDGQDTIVATNAYKPQLMGEIRLAANVDLAMLDYSYGSASTTITYGAGDQLTVEADTVYTFRDNPITRFTLVSEADPGWIPLIQPEGYVGNVYGTFGADHIVGNYQTFTILPGYGDDIIEAGSGGNQIVLNDVYVNGQGGIGHKEIWGQEGADLIETPLYQGLTFHYDRGDGFDTIAYDWSFSGLHPYQLGANLQYNVLTFLRYGDDTLSFGPDINLQDLEFLRLGQSLIISLLDGSGSVRVEEFFHAWDFDGPAWTGDVGDLIFTEGEGGLDTLLHPAVLAVIPATPVSWLRFADGSVVSMAEVLATSLQEAEVTVLGTEGDDWLFGNTGDDIIHALGGNDTIEDWGGDNVILAGSGDDLVAMIGSGDNIVDLGPGLDLLSFPEGNQTVIFGPGNDFDVYYFREELNTVVVEVAEGISIDDFTVTLTESNYGPAPQLTLGDTGDALIMAAYQYDWVSGDSTAVPDSQAYSLHFADGTVVTGEEIYALATAVPGETIIGTDGDDMLTGGAGNDTIIGGLGNDSIDGAGGDDIFLVEGRQQGKDHFVGGEGFDTILGGDGDDTIGLTGLLVMDGIERIDGGAGVNTLISSSGNNTLYFGATELLNIAAIEGRGGRDVITGSAGDDVIVGGWGNDTLGGGAGSDSYVFGAGDGRDVINNGDTDPDSFDALHLLEIEYDQVWLSRKNQHLYLNVAGSTERVVIKKWYSDEAAQLDAVYAGDRFLMRDQVDQLVNAMAAFDVPEGVGVMIPDEVRLALEPVLASAWQTAA